MGQLSPIMGYIRGDLPDCETIAYPEKQSWTNVKTSATRSLIRMATQPLGGSASALGIFGI